jgi:hypothetical protein
MAAKPEVVKSHVLEQIDMRFQRLYTVLGVCHASALSKSANEDMVLLFMYRLVKYISLK